MSMNIDGRTYRGDTRPVHHRNGEVTAQCADVCRRELRLRMAKTGGDGSSQQWWTIPVGEVGYVLVCGSCVAARLEPELREETREMVRKLR